MVKLFKHVAFWEGVSLVLLVFIAMPLKYRLDYPEAVSVVGMAHGVLFVFYAVMAVMLYKKLEWSFRIFIIVIIASLVPFGTFYMEQRYSRIIYGNH